MTLFRFYARDISSDDGFVEILVFGDSERQAKSYLDCHLESVNRGDLIGKFSLVNTYGITPGVISSNVEVGCD